MQSNWTKYTDKSCKTKSKDEVLNATVFTPPAQNFILFYTSRMNMAALPIAMQNGLIWSNRSTFDTHFTWNNGQNVKDWHTILLIYLIQKCGKPQITVQITAPRLWFTASTLGIFKSVMVSKDIVDHKSNLAVNFCISIHYNMTMYIFILELVTR